MSRRWVALLVPAGALLVVAGLRALGVTAELLPRSEWRFGAGPLLINYRQRGGGGAA